MEGLNAMQEYVELLLRYTRTGAWRSGGAWGTSHSTDQPIEEAHRYWALWGLGVGDDAAGSAVGDR